MNRTSHASGIYPVFGYWDPYPKGPSTRIYSILKPKYGVLYGSVESRSLLKGYVKEFWP